MATPPVPGAGSLPRRVLDFLRSFGRREQVFRAEPKGQYLSDYSLFAAYGYQDMAEYLRLEADLQSRFIDYEDMDDYVETCLAGDSTVFTLEWGWKEIRWLAERKEPFHVLSYDAKRKSLVPARSDGAALTGAQGHEKPMVRVTLDNGQTVRCTADHLFMTRGGEWVAAGRLVPGQRLMPGDLRLLPLNSNESQTYWQVCQPGQDADLKASRNNRWVWVHRLVGETMLGLKKNEVVHHHEEGGPWNNAPKNLEALDRAAHAKHHLGPIDNSRFFPAWTEERRRGASERMLGNTHHTGVKATKETRQKMSEAKRGRRLSPEHRQHIGDAHRIVLDPSKVTEAFRTGGTVVNTAKLLGVSWSTARRAVERVGLVGAGNNHRVLSVEPILGGEPVYDITVPGYRNFVCNGVVVHNSNALDIYADEATQPDPETGKTVWIEADVGDIKDKLKFLFERRLKIDDEVWEIARALCKYGNEYEELLVTGDGVMGLYHLPAPSVRRVEKDKGVLLGFVQSITGSSFSLTPEQFEELLRDPEKRRGYPDATFEDWQVAHFRFRSRLRRAKYGYSVLEPARWIWKRLLLLEDSALIYKLTRAPSRFVFTVDVGTIPRNEIFGVLNKWKDHFKKRKLIDPKSGQLTMRFNPLSYDEDFFLPKAGGEKLAEIDTLQGPNFQAMEDVEYFRSKLFSALKIPKAYMGYEESETKATLSMEDVRWARTIMRVQRELRTGLKRIGNIHLVALGIDPAAVDWDVVMVIPSAIFELAQLEVRNARAEFAEKMEKWVSNYWIMRNVFGFSDEEIEAIQKQRAKESSGEEEPPPKGKRKREGEEPRHVLLPGGRRVEPGNIFGSNRARRDLQPLTEEWLFKGGKRDHEKYLEDNFKKVLRRDQEFSARLFEVRETMMELKHALQGRKGR